MPDKSEGYATSAISSVRDSLVVLTACSSFTSGTTVGLATSLRESQGQMGRPHGLAKRLSDYPTLLGESVAEVEVMNLCL